MVVSRVYSVSLSIICGLALLAPSSAWAENLASSSWRMFGLIGFETWQETVIISDPLGNDNVLKASNQGVCPGFGGSRAFGVYEIELSICALFAKSSIANASSIASPTVSYSSFGNQMSGGMVEISGLWMPVDGSHFKVGATIPVIYRTVNWPDPGNGAFFSRNLKILSGIEINSEFDFDTLFISPRLGFLIEPSNFSMNLVAGLRL